MRANNGDALVTAAVAGLGVLYEPEFIVADAIRQGALERIALDADTADLGGIHLVRAPERAPPAKVRVVSEFLVAAFNPSPLDNFMMCYLRRRQLDMAGRESATPSPLSCPIRLAKLS
ncbi:LysR substrate-binding domain-containing protein [Variovorax paradoxus]|uniref:LysR substrate-binding domain-containing protein n=1 Tax=Variovorax paradoxus TaxID=34073 RepID=UPI0021AD4AE6|nr:LysR substrate-binding domain-containing protein [Variovorax paradoxus]UVH58597.1 LysR substrate-binding domain-containing protein [Variovorax paradoxus]